MGRENTGVKKKQERLKMNFYKVKQPELLIFNYFHPQKQQFQMVSVTAKVNVDLIFTFISLIPFNCKMCT